MSQNVVNYGIDPSGAQLLDELLSGEQQNRLTMDGGNSRPPYAEIGTIWTDKSVTGKATLKRFNGTSDNVIMTIDETTGAITIPGIADTDLSNLSESGNSKFQAPLVSGTNIKTINGDSILGSGNLTISAGANIALTNSPYTTNRILEVPQNIKMELNSGTVTLKAGSKVYVPNGFEEDGVTPKFDVITIESDLTKASYGYAVQTLFFVNPSNTGVYDIYTEQCFSGTVAPTAYPSMVWYDTANNLVKLTSNSGSTWISGYSLPIGLATSTTTTYTSIDQIFNEFGFVGSTLFILPGIKVQIPDGKNEDGTFKYIFFAKTNVEIQTLSGSGTNWLDVFISPTQIYCLRDLGNIVYDSDTNLNVDPVDDYPFIIGQAFLQNGRFTKIIPCAVDAVANSNASNFSKAGRSKIFEWGVPDYSAAIDYTSSWGTDVVAPSNGFVYASSMTTNSGGTYLRINNVYFLVTGNSGSSPAIQSSLWLPVKKGDKFTGTNGSGSGRSLSFYPAI